MKKLLLKSVTVLMCVLLVLSVLFACGSSNEPSGNNTTSGGVSLTESSSQTSENAGNPNGLPFVEDGSVTLTVATYDNWYSPASYANNLDVFQELEKRTGVKINWEVTTPSEYADVISTRIAVGGDNLPDILNLRDDPVKLASGGIIIPLEELVARNAPNTLKYFVENPVVKAVSYGPDGHMYQFLTVKLGSLYFNHYTFNIRKDWLDKLQLKEPDTTDEWYYVFKAFKEMDNNGNGKKDEIPLTIEGLAAAKFMGGAWGLHLSNSDGFTADKDGKVSFDYVDPKMKEYIVYMNKLFNEGLLDPEFVTIDRDKMISKLVRNITGTAIIELMNVPNLETGMKKAGLSDVHFLPLGAMKGPGGQQIMEGDGPTGGAWAISKSCKNPDIAVKWLDYIYASKEGNDLLLYGIEGKSYTRKDGKISFTDFIIKNPDGLGSQDALRSMGALPNLPYILTTEFFEVSSAAYPDLVAAAKRIAPMVVIPFPPMLMTSEEQKTWTSLYADLSTYRDEMMVKFIIGDESIDKFDTFVKIMKDKGIDKLISIKQAAYDRYSKLARK